MYALHVSSSSQSSSATTTTLPPPAGGYDFSNLLLDDTFDNACDAGQFFLNPCWYLYSRLEKAWTTAAAARRRQRRAKHGNENNNTSNIHEAAASEGDGDTSFNYAAERTRKTKFQSTIQQSIYLICFYVVWAVVVTYIYPLIRTNNNSILLLSNLHTIMIGNILFGASMASYIAAKLSSPGNITAETMSRFDNYLYDNVLYMANHNVDDTTTITTTNNNICPTLGIRKLARSKYDRFSQTHVPRFDHYCGWLGTSVGEENYRFFLAFVLFHTMLSTYGTFVLVALLWITTTTTTTTNSSGGAAKNLHDDESYGVATATIGIIAMISAMFSCLTVIHSTFHILLVVRGQTTNEHYKWKQLLLLDAAAAAARINHGRRQQPQQPAVVSTPDSSRLEEDIEECHALPLSPIGYVFSASSSLTLGRAQQQNFYNLGIAGNIYEVLFPRSLRSDAGSKKDS
jgi:DHHC palmitoyltransferase